MSIYAAILVWGSNLTAIVILAVYGAHGLNARKRRA